MMGNGCLECARRHGPHFTGACDCDKGRPRSYRRDVMNPLAGLRSAQRIRALPDEARSALRDLLLDLQKEANAKAEKCWTNHKPPMAAYWKAVAVNAGHIAKLAR